MKLKTFAIFLTVLGLTAAEPARSLGKAVADWFAYPYRVTILDEHRDVALQGGVGGLDLMLPEDIEDGNYAMQIEIYGGPKTTHPFRVSIFRLSRPQALSHLPDIIAR